MVNSMAEVGLVRFARVAVEVAETVLQDYRTKFSKHTFTQPQLLAVLCLMHYEDCVIEVSRGNSLCRRRWRRRRDGKCLFLAFATLYSAVC